MAKNYIDRPVGRQELEALARIATNEEVDFFARNPHTVEPYRNRLLAIALCQGAALQYLGRGYGVNDFDIHYFYAQNPTKPRLSRTIKPVVASVGTFTSVAVHFIRTVVPHVAPAQEPKTILTDLRTFLRQRSTTNAAYLAEKAVVGLWPAALFGKTIWLAAEPVVPPGRQRK